MGSHSTGIGHSWVTPTCRSIENANEKQFSNETFVHISRRPQKQKNIVAPPGEYVENL